jgi:hypothetical protein
MKAYQREKQLCLLEIFRDYVKQFTVCVYFEKESTEIIPFPKGHVSVPTELPYYERTSFHVMPIHSEPACLLCYGQCHCVCHGNTSTCKIWNACSCSIHVKCVNTCLTLELLWNDETNDKAGYIVEKIVYIHSDSCCSLM